MRHVVGGIVFLSQTDASSLEALAKMPWYVIAFLAIGGSGVIAAAVARVWAFISHYLTTKQQQAIKLADEERARRDARTKAEVEQLEALTTMARDMPKHFTLLTNEIKESNVLMRQEIAENTRAVNGFVAAWNDEKRILLAAIAQKLGVPTKDDSGSSGTRRVSSSGL
jgi:hypothetical protein